ncbi:unnamed protein product [Meloidogyne enterolobii]|uniref:Uncharacterized protein n=1 Tax=Meloidogyne enterolobii TaxID=390850 RepID=A0ACB1ABU2_MELEN
MIELTFASGKFDLKLENIKLLPLILFYLKVGLSTRFNSNFLQLLVLPPCTYLFALYTRKFC